MKILFLTDAFNGMAQRLWIELDRLNHEVKVEIVTSTDGLEDKANAYKPELIIAPFLTSKIPTAIWKNYTCLVVHPGIKGDRGASSLDWAILNKENTWGVTILEAVEKMDAGAIWAEHKFEMRSVTKAELYRNEVAQAASKGILESIEKIGLSNFTPEDLDYNNPSIQGTWNNKAKQKDYNFSWTDTAEEIINKINAADSSPGVLIILFNQDFYCYGAHKESDLKGNPGDILAQRNNAICIATKNNAVWLTHLKSATENSIKLPAMLALANLQKTIPNDQFSPFDSSENDTWQEIKFEQEDKVGYLHFNFYNGAMSTDQCIRLKEAIVEAKKRVKLIVLLGGQDVWSNGIHLNVIENSENPAENSWDNINAIDDLILEIIQSVDHYIICALQGNAGAGGVSLALSGDKVLTRDGVVLNPHTKNMGLYGSEYWTYLLPKRIGIDKATKFTEECLPWGVDMAKEIGLIDENFGQTNKAFVQFVKDEAHKIISLPYFEKLLQAKKIQRRKDEMNKPLEKYREEELLKMKANFFEDTMNYNYKRHCFVYKIPSEDAEEIANLYESRRAIYRKRKWESIEYKDE